MLQQASQSRFVIGDTKIVFPVVVVVIIVGGGRGGITFGGTSTGLTILVVPLLDMEAVIDVELEDDPTPNLS